MTRIRSAGPLPAALLASAALVLAGCGGSDNESNGSRSTPKNLDEAISQCLDQAKQLPDAQSRNTAEEACKAAKSGNTTKVKEAAKKQCLDALKQVPDGPQKDQAKKRCEAIQ
ncbi:MAG: hypothetical protein QOG86_2049 [Thermoleophilaceae bacterium]|nr:hypothetical protein [Thermoleophilaceae bacterium]